MKAPIDTAEGRARYADRFGTVEPVFANVCYNKRLARFTPRSQRKVDGQWRLSASCTTSRSSRGTDTPRREGRMSAPGATRVATRDKVQLTITPRANRQNTSELTYSTT